jgi:hypothetical protein
LAASLLVLWGVVGCAGSDGLNRQPVTGSVTLDGTPLDKGTIRFMPTTTEATTETSTTSSGGKYTFGKDSGPVPGEYKVSISAVDDPNIQAKDGMVPGEYRPPTNKDKVPAKFNSNTTLTAKVQSGQSSPIDFTLTSK